MTDTFDSAKFYSSVETHQRLRRRKRAETRLKLYGIGAIFLASLALIALLWSVVGKATGALSESYVTLPVSLEQAKLDPDGNGDYKTILRANFTGLTKDTLKATFSTVKDRRLKRQLYDVVSGGAAFELAETVASDPGLLGQTIDFRFLASDVTDLYLKGAYGSLEEQPVHGKLSISEVGGKLTITSTSNDFAAILATVKRHLILDANRLKRQAAMQDNGYEVFFRRAGETTDEDERARLLILSDERAAERDRLLAQAAELVTRASGARGEEPLSDENRSVLIRVAGGWVKLTAVNRANAVGEILLPLNGPVENSGEWELMFTELPEVARKVSDHQIAWIEHLKSEGRTDTVFNTRFFTAGDSREPELAGVWGAIVGTFWTMLVTFALAFPIGVLTAIYLEEFAPKNRLTHLIEVNINNLAAVPSIVFGLLGLAVFLTVFGVPRSAPLAGGIVLALMTLPTVIIAARAAIRAVPPSIRDAALGVGASKIQTSFHHVLPLAMPGILTGTIIGMAQALGETAPLILIGMVAFIVEIPTGITDSATVLPVQIFRWSDFPERAFEARTAAAICVLLVFLVCMNALAVFLRRKIEIRW